MMLLLKKNILEIVLFLSMYVIIYLTKKLRGYGFLAFLFAANYFLKLFK